MPCARSSNPLFKPSLVHNSYANRNGKGTHRTIARHERSHNRFRDVLRRNIRRYFPSVDHGALKRDLRRPIACPRTLALAARPNAAAGLAAVCRAVPGERQRLPESNVRRIRNRLRERWRAGSAMTNGGRPSCPAVAWGLNARRVHAAAAQANARR